MIALKEGLIGRIKVDKPSAIEKRLSCNMADVIELDEGRVLRDPYI